MPVAPADVTAKRSGDRVVIRFTIPRANQSGIQPADIEQMEVYAWTPPAPDPTQPPAAAQLLPEQIFKYAKLVATVPVRRPPPPPPEQKEGEPPPPPPPPPTGPGLDQGVMAEVVDTLVAADARADRGAEEEAQGADDRRRARPRSRRRISVRPCRRCRPAPTWWSA